LSFREIIVSIRAVNRASAEFNRINTDAQMLSARMKTLGATISGIGASGVALGYLANQFGVLNDEQTKVFNSAMMLVSVLGVLMRSEMAIAAAHKIYAAACTFATTIQNALNISYSTFLALTGVGVAVIIAAAAAMYSFANSMNSATSSVQSFNSAASEVPGRTRSIQRAGEAQLYRRGIE
jgi:hypothetical protein